MNKKRLNHTKKISKDGYEVVWETRRWVGGECLFLCYKAGRDKIKESCPSSRKKVAKALRKMRRYMREVCMAKALEEGDTDYLGWIEGKKTKIAHKGSLSVGYLTALEGYEGVIVHNSNMQDSFDPSTAYPFYKNKY